MTNNPTMVPSQDFKPGNLPKTLIHPPTGVAVRLGARDEGFDVFAPTRSSVVALFSSHHAHPLNAIRAARILAAELLAERDRAHTEAFDEMIGRRIDAAARAGGRTMGAGNVADDDEESLVFADESN